LQTFVLDLLELGKIELAKAGLLLNLGEEVGDLRGQFVDLPRSPAVRNSRSQ
jgi:hypothetical protein